MIAKLLIATLLLPLNAAAPEPKATADAQTQHARPVTPLAEVLVIGEPADAAFPDLILIPGIGLSLEAWRPWMESNAGRYRMHAVTLPGMAGTAPPPIPDPPTSDTPLLDNAAAAIAAYINDNDLVRPVILGHGTGGMVAMLTGVRFPELVGAVASITMAPAVPISSEPLTQAERAEQAFAFIQPRNAAMTEQQVAAALQGTYFNALDPGPLRDRVLRDAAACEPHVLSQYWPEVVFTDLIDAIAANESLPVLLCLPAGGPFRQADQWHAIADAADSILLVEFTSSRSFCHYDQPERFEAALQALFARARPD